MAKKQKHFNIHGTIRSLTRKTKPPRNCAVTTGRFYCYCETVARRTTKPTFDLHVPKAPIFSFEICNDSEHKIRFALTPSMISGPTTARQTFFSLRKYNCSSMIPIVQHPAERFQEGPRSEKCINVHMQQLTCCLYCRSENPIACFLYCLWESCNLAPTSQATTVETLPESLQVQTEPVYIYLKFLPTKYAREAHRKILARLRTT